MNKWIRRAVGTVGIAGGALLLGAGTAHADDSVTAAEDPQLLHGLVEDLFSPTGGAGMSLDTPGHRTTTGLLPGGPVQMAPNDGDVGMVLHAPDQNGQPRDVYAGGKMPDVFRALPITDAVPADGLGIAPKPATTEGLPVGAGGLPVGNSPLDLPRGLTTNGVGLPVDGVPFSGGPATGGGLPIGGGSLPPLGRGLPTGAGLPSGLPTGAGLPAGAGLPSGLPTGAGLPSGLPTGAGLPSGLPTGAGLPSGLPTGAGLPAGAGLPSGLPTGSPLPAGGGVHDIAGAAKSVMLGDAVHVLPPGEGLPLGGGLPAADGLPILGEMLADTALPFQGNVNTLPNTPAIPLGQPLGSSMSDPTAERPVVGEAAPANGALGGLPLGGLPLGGLPLGALPLGALPLGALPLNGLPVGTLPVGTSPISSGRAPAPAGTMYNPRHAAAADRPVAGELPATEGLPAEQLPGANMLPVVDGVLSSTPAGDLPIFSTLLSSAMSQMSGPAVGGTATDVLPVQANQVPR
jgi:hypothetical protein